MSLYFYIFILSTSKLYITEMYLFKFCPISDLFLIHYLLFISDEKHPVIKIL